MLVSGTQGHLRTVFWRCKSLYVRVAPCYCLGGDGVEHCGWRGDFEVDILCRWGWGLKEQVCRCMHTSACICIDLQGDEC